MADHTHIQLFSGDANYEKMATFGLKDLGISLFLLEGLKTSLDEV